MVSAAEMIVRPLESVTPRNCAAGVVLQRAHEDRQAEHAVDDRGHAGQVVDVGADNLVEPVVGRILFQVDRRADADRERDQHGQRDHPERAEDRGAHAGELRLAVHRLGQEVAIRATSATSAPRSGCCLGDLLLDRGALRTATHHSVQLSTTSRLNDALVDQIEHLGLAALREGLLAIQPVVHVLRDLRLEERDQLFLR